MPEKLQAEGIINLEKAAPEGGVGLIEVLASADFLEALAQASQEQGWESASLC